VIGGGDGGSAKLLNLCQNDHDDPNSTTAKFCVGPQEEDESRGGVVLAMK